MGYAVGLTQSSRHVQDVGGMPSRTMGSATPVPSIRPRRAEGKPRAGSQGRHSCPCATAQESNTSSPGSSPPDILYPSRGSVTMYLGLSAESPSLRRSRLTTSHTSQLSPTRSELHTRWGNTVLKRTGRCQAETEASTNAKAVYELPDGSNVSSAETTLTCTVAE